MMPDCPNLAVPAAVLQHVVRVESGFHPYAIGVVGGRLARQPRNLPEAVATANMLEQQGYNFSLGLAQVNRYNLRRHGLGSYEQAFTSCDNLRAGSRILQECYQRAGDWGKAFSCYYSGNFTTGFRHGYVQKVMAQMQPGMATQAMPIPVIGKRKTAAGKRVAAVPRSVTPASVPAPVSATVPAAVAPAVAAGDTRFVF